MLPAERHIAIVQIVNSKGSIRVKELSRMLDVTEETIRRDLDALESERKLRRSHGGAMRIQDDPGEVPYLERENNNVSEKRAIAQMAVQFINPGDQIALDASTTAWQLATALPDMPLTVLTNSLKVALELSTRDKVEVISTGGILRSSSLSYVGPLAEESLERFHVNKAFVSCKGLHTKCGLTESSALQAPVKRKMIEIADQVFVLADHSKIQVCDFVNVTSLNEIDVLVTNEQVPQEWIDEFRQFNMQIIQV